MVPAIVFLATQNVSAGEDILWTDRPVRIDRSKQTFERLPPALVNVDKRTWLTVPFKIQTLDSTRFAFDGKIFRIDGLIPVEAKRMCRTADGGRWTCGRAATAMLSYLVRGKKILCMQTTSDKETVLSDCITGAKEIGPELVKSGLARNQGNPELQELEELAHKRGAGLWRNPECVSDFQHC